jgi:ketosteroid isomerase-like protein
MNELDKTIHPIVEKYKAAVLAKDAAALMRLYDPKVRVFDAWGVWSYEGAPAWQRTVEAWFSSLGTERVKVTFEDLQCVGTPELAMASAVVTYAGLSAQGEQLRAMQNRLSWGLKASGHVLRIAHEHTSLPVGFDDAKAIMLRPASA